MKALRMHIIGTSGYTPYPSKTARLFTSCRLFFGNKSLQIDIGNKYSGLPVDYLLVTHCHYDHIQAIETLPERVQILIPSLTFEGTLTIALEQGFGEDTALAGLMTREAS